MTVPSMVDRPFGAPLEPSIVLDLPVPPSVNETRRVDWKTSRKHKGWQQRADNLVLAARGRTRKIKGPYELTIVMSEAHTRIDLDNGIKSVIDYLRRIEVIENDDRRYVRRLVVEWGTAPEGCRVTVKTYRPTPKYDFGWDIREELA